MGCDIHGWVERKVEGKWIAIKELKDRERNYPRFNKLAGVRPVNDEDTAIEPLGLPEDASDTVKYHVEEWGADGHSHSWMPLRKAFKIFKETARGEETSPWSFFDVEIDEDENWEYRLVFWFDN